MVQSIIRDYLTLGIDAQTFLEHILRNDALLGEIQSRIPESKCAFDEVWKDCPLRVEALEYCDFDLRRLLSRGYYSLTRVWSCDAGYNLIYDLFHDDFPDVARSDHYHKIAMFAMEVVPEVVDSAEAGPVLMKIIESTNEMKTGRKKVARDRIRTAFHLDESKKRPCWAQGSQWPVAATGKPMRFLGQKTDGDRVCYCFEDVDTLEKRTIVDYF